MAHDYDVSDDMYDQQHPINIGTTIMSEVNLDGDDGRGGHVDREDRPKLNKKRSSSKRSKSGKRHRESQQYDRAMANEDEDDIVDDHELLKPMPRKSTRDRIILSPKPRKRATVKRSRTSMSHTHTHTRTHSTGAGTVASGTGARSSEEMRGKLKEEMLEEIKGELLGEMQLKNKELLAEIDKLKTEIKDISQHNNVNQEWPKLEIKDRATLRKKLAKEIKQHANKRTKKVFKLEKKVERKEKQLERYKKEIHKLEHQLRKHGVQYVGPPEEDAVWRLLFCQAYRSQKYEVDTRLDEELSVNYDRRFSIMHQEAKLEERQVQRKWAELFTDLIFVAIIVKFASQINSRYVYYAKLGNTTEMMFTLVNGFLFFFPFWCLWLELTLTLIRFHDFEGKWYGLIDDALIFIVLAGVIEISFQIDINANLFSSKYANRFLIGFGMSVVALLLLHIFYWWKLGASKRYSTRRIWSYGLALAVLCVTMVDPTNPMYVVLSVCLSSMIMLYVSCVSFRVHPLSHSSNEHVHNHAYHIFCLESIVERFGIFSMIVIGESILALLISPDPQSFIRYICVYFAFGLLFTFQLMYFGSHAEEGCHALHKLGFPGSVFWIFIHLPLSTGLLFVGIGLHLLVTFADLEFVPPQISIVLVVSTMCTIVNYHILRRCHDKFQLSIPSLLRVLPILICPVCLFVTLDSFGVILWCFIITVCSWFFDVILIKEYETKPIWMSHHQNHCEFQFHPEEYNPLYLPYDSFLFCRNYDGEHGRTIVVSLAEYIIDEKLLQQHYPADYGNDMMLPISSDDDEYDTDKAMPGHRGDGRQRAITQPPQPPPQHQHQQPQQQQQQQHETQMQMQTLPQRPKTKDRHSSDATKASNSQLRMQANVSNGPSVKIARGSLPKSPNSYLNAISGGKIDFFSHEYDDQHRALKDEDEDEDVDDDEDEENDDADSTKQPGTAHAGATVGGTGMPSHGHMLPHRSNNETLPPPQAMLSAGPSPYSPLSKPIHADTSDDDDDDVQRSPLYEVEESRSDSTNNKTVVTANMHGHSMFLGPNQAAPLVPLSPPDRNKKIRIRINDADLYDDRAQLTPATDEDNLTPEPTDDETENDNDREDENRKRTPSSKRSKEKKRDSKSKSKSKSKSRHSKHKLEKTDSTKEEQTQQQQPQQPQLQPDEKEEENHLGVNKDEAHEIIKLRSPNLDGMQLIQQYSTTTTSAKTSAPAAATAAMDEDDESIPSNGITPRGSSTNVFGENRMNLPVVPYSYGIQKSRSHETGGGADGGGGHGAVDWHSWMHDIEEDHEETEEHRHQWFSEFADLVFVAIIINFADQIKNIAVNQCVHNSTANYIEIDCLTVLFLEAALFFLGFFTVWYELSVTLIRFTEVDGIFDDVLKFFYLAGIVTMTLQMEKTTFLSDHLSGFIMGIIICLLCITLLHIVYYFYVENCQLYARKRIMLYCVSILVLLLVSVVDDKFVSFLAITVVSVVILWISSNSFRVVLTPNEEMLELPEDVFEKIVERWGIFVMIATGESILALIATTNKLVQTSDGDDASNAKEENIEFQHYVAILCAFGITYLVSHYYLESSKVNNMHFHALMHSGSPGSVMWTLLHGLLGFFLMMVGAGWKLVLLSLSLEICWLEAEDYYEFETYEGNKAASYAKYKCCDTYHLLGECQEYDGDGWMEFSVMLGCGLMASLITMYLLRTAHPKFIFSWKSVLCRIPIILMIPVGAYWTSSFETQSFYYSIWCMILMTIGYFVDHLFIDIYQTDIRPDLRTFYNTQVDPMTRETSLRMLTDLSKRKSVSVSHTHSHHPSTLNRQHSLSRSKSHTNTRSKVHSHR